MLAKIALIGFLLSGMPMKMTLIEESVIPYFLGVLAMTLAIKIEDRAKNKKTPAYPIIILSFGWVFVLILLPFIHLCQKDKK